MSMLAPAAVPIMVPTKRKKVRAADLLCGAGGWTEGFRLACEDLDFEPSIIGINHWDLAVETFGLNHPNSIRLCQDVEMAKPREVVPGGRLDLLLASPECIFHSRARGGRPIDDQRRATPWCVTRWAADLYIRKILVENVPEFVDWGPINAQGRPIKSRKGETFRAWVAALEALGYRVEYRVLNAADYGDATTRQRFFLQARRDGRKIRWPEPTHSKDGVTTLFGKRKPWRAAREIIDWNLKGTSVFTRPLPLKPNTIRRLMVGVSRFFGELEPIYTFLLERELQRSIARWGDSKNPSKMPRKPANDDAAAGPLIFAHRSNVIPRPVSGPAPTITKSGNVALVEPILLPQGSNSPPRDTSGPIPALVTHGKPAIAEAFVLAQGSLGAPRQVKHPLPTILQDGAISMTEAFVVRVDQTGKEGGRVRSADQPVPTMSRKGSFATAVPFLAPFYRTGVPDSVEDPVATLSTKMRHALVEAEPFVLAQGSNGAPRATKDPVPTILQAGKVAVAEPFIVPQFGERPGQTPRTHSLKAPLPAVTSHGAGALVEPWVEINGEVIYCDLLFRMLVNDELGRATSFDAGGKMYRFAGKKTEVTAQIGNAVPIRLARALCRTALED